MATAGTNRIADLAGRVRTTVATQDDLLATGKALRDTLRKDLGNELGGRLAALEAWVKSAEDRLAEAEARRKADLAAHAKRTAALDLRVKSAEGRAIRAEALLKETRVEFARRADHQAKAYRDEAARLKAGYEARYSFFEKSLAAQAENLKAVLEAAPPPQVFVPPEAIVVRHEVKHLVEVPPGAFSLEVGDLRAVLQVPDRAFNVTVDQPAPVLQVPPARLVSKSITYDNFNRPVEIVEREVDGGREDA